MSGVEGVPLPCNGGLAFHRKCFESLTNLTCHEHLLDDIHVGKHDHIISRQLLSGELHF